MTGQELYNLFDKHIGVLDEHGFFTNMKWENLSKKEKLWYDTVADKVELKEKE